MITNITVENFKNFRGRVSIDVCDPNSDGSYLNVIVGRNGSGKSCVIEAIDWCIFRGTARDMRGGNVRDLVNTDAADGDRMAVTCTLYSPPLKKTLVIERSYHNGSSHFRCDVHDESGHVASLSAKEMTAALKDMGIPADQLECIRARQSESTFLCQSPMKLIEFIEEVCGSSELQRDIAVLKKSIEEEAVLFETASKASNQLNTDIEALEPKVAAIRDHFIRKHKAICLQSVLLHQAQEVRSDEIKQLNLDFDSNKRHMETISTSITHRDDELRVLDKQHDSGERSLKELMTSHEADKKRRQQSDKKRAAIEDKRRRLVAIIDQKSKELEDGKAKLRETIESIEAQERTVTALHQERHNIQNSIGLYNRLTSGECIDEETNQVVREYLNSKEAFKNKSKFESILASQKQYETKLAQYSKEVATIQKSNDTIDARINEIKTSISAKDTELHSKIASQSQINSELILCKQSLSALENELEEAKKHSSASKPIRNKSLSISSIIESIIRDEATRDGRICSSLLRLISPVDDQYSTAILAVLGVHANKTVIVESRDMAVRLANTFASKGIGGIRFEIVDEIDARRVELQHHKAKLSQHCIHLIDALGITDPRATPAILRLVKNWILCKRDHKFGSDIAKSVPQFNVVTIDGCRFLNDGEINYSPNQNISKSTAWADIVATDTDPSISISADRIPDLQHQIRQLHGDINRLTANLSKTSSEITSMEKELVASRNDIKRLTNQLTPKPKPPIRRYNDDEVAEAIEYMAKIHQLEGTLKSRMKNIRFESVLVYDIISSEPSNQKRLMKIDSDIRSANSDIASLNEFRESMTVSIHSIERSIGDPKSKLARLNAELDKISSELGPDLAASSSDTTLADAKANLQEIAHARSKVVNEIVDLKAKSAVERERGEAIAKQRRDAQTELQSIVALVQETSSLSQHTTSILIEQFHISPAEVDSIGNQHEDNLSDIDKMKDKAVLDQRIRTISDTISYLQDAETGMDMQMVAKMEQLKSDLTLRHIEMDGNKAKMIDMQGNINILQLRRYDQLHSTLSRLNASVARIYPQLKTSGECYLSYPSDSASLYNEGVSLMARSDGRPWMEIKNMSGGQQAACGVTMILAIQDQFPSPVYLLDEIDAFLDAKISDNLGRLLQYRSQTSGSQFIVVSHKPELHLHADRITALSFDGEAISAITMPF